MLQPQQQKGRMREINESDFLKVYMGDSNRQPHPSRKRERERARERERERERERRRESSRILNKAKLNTKFNQY